MTGHDIFHYACSFTNAQLSLLKVAALYFDKLVMLVRSARVGQLAAQITRPRVGTLPQDASVREMVTLTRQNRSLGGITIMEPKLFSDLLTP